MSSLRIFLLMLASSLMVSLDVIPESCDVKLSYDFFEAKTTEQSKLVIKPIGGTPPYHVVLYEKDGKIASIDFTKTEYTGLKPGRYQCIVVDSQNCRKEIAIDIK